MIDYYELIIQAKNYYEKLLYNYVNLEWAIEEEYVNITFDKSYKLDSLCLIGSAEQAFLKEAINKNIKEKKLYQSITPCFRNETNVDKYHQKYFLKLELFYFFKADSFDIYGEETKFVLNKFLNDAYNFFSLYTYETDLTYTQPKLKENEYEVDINLFDIEIGSYGIRYNPENKIKWVYGTGLALPRFTTVLMEKHNDKRI